jgi:hypothetical protein
MPKLSFKWHVDSFPTSACTLVVGKVFLKFESCGLKVLMFCESIFDVFGWLQGRVAHFLHCNPFFCRVVCIYMLLKWHKNNNFQNLWLNLDCQLEKESIY